MNRLKILHFDEGFWLYYYRLENNRLKWPTTKEEAIKEIVYVRTKQSKNIGKKDNLVNLEKVVIEHKPEESKDLCDKCNSSLTVIGRKSKEVLKYIPAKLYIEDHVTYSYACRPCEANIVTTKAPNTIVHKSMASNELVSHVINMKYQHAMPLYRQETYFKMLGANKLYLTGLWVQLVHLKLYIA